MCHPSRFRTTTLAFHNSSAMSIFSPNLGSWRYVMQVRAEILSGKMSMHPWIHGMVFAGRLYSQFHAAHGVVPMPPLRTQPTIDLIKPCRAASVITASNIFFPHTLFSAYPRSPSQSRFTDARELPVVMASSSALSATASNQALPLLQA